MSAPYQVSKHWFADHIEPYLRSEKDLLNSKFDYESGVYIYGAGELGVLAISYCESCSIPIHGVLDRNKIGVMKGRTAEYTIKHPDLIELQENKDVLVVVAIATVPFGDIRKQLTQSGWNHVSPFYNLTTKQRKGHPLRNGWALGKVTDHEIDTVRWVCQKWEDDISFHHYEAFIAWHRDNTEIDLEEYPIDAEQRYVIPQLQEVLRACNQQFVDIGSHRGESVHRLNKAGILFNEYILIEPDALSRKIIESNLHELFSENVQVSIRDAILGDYNHFVPFKEGLGYSSQIWDESTEHRQVMRLDDLELQPSFLKIHTEGTEWNILRGAQKTIASNRPCIAFSVYHSRNGFFSDIAGAMRLFSGYRWFFRLHSYQGTGAFVYAIPDSSPNQRLHVH